jgi:aldose 1-epimerase
MTPTNSAAVTTAKIDPALVALAAGELRLVLAPSIGGSIASFRRHWHERGQDRITDWLRPATTEALAACDPQGMGSFPLVPFCNRLRNGRGSFEGREIRFPPNHPKKYSPHPLHGLGWQRPWQLISSSTAEATLGLDVPATQAWPWRFSARQHFALHARELIVHMSLTNADTAAMPAGIGHHPYFPHAPGTRLCSRTSAMWKADEEVMPIGLVANETVDKLRQGVLLSELDLDNNFVGWDRSAQIDWPADAQGPARSLQMQAQAPLDYFVLFCPSGYDYFCAEPVSQCTDWLNLVPPYTHEQVGGHRLEPGATLEVRFALTPQWN